MAKTSFTTNNALTKKAWEEQLFRDNIKEAYFSRFMSESDNTPVYVDSKFTRELGDKVTFGIRMRMTGAGVTSGQTLEGNEESLVTHDYSISLEQYRWATRVKGKLDLQRAMFSIDQQSENGLKDWGSEKIDSLCFDAIQASPTKIFYGDGTSTSTITTSGKIAPALISKARVWGLTGGNRTQTPLRPIKIDGKKYLILVVHPDVMYDLKQDSTFAQARREALERGKDNPIFSGASAIWDGVVIHEHENVNIVTNWGSGSNVPGATNFLMGAQALCWAWGQKPEVITETFDYKNEHGFAWEMIARCGKPVFNSKDYGSIAVYTARTQISDA